MGACFSFLFPNQSDVYKISLGVNNYLPPPRLRFLRICLTLKYLRYLPDMLSGYVHK